MADEHEREHQHEHELPGLPPSVLLEKYGEEIRSAIMGAIDAGVAGARRTSTRWCIGTILAAMVGSGAVTWIVAPPSRPASQWFVHHADGLIETCILTTESAGDRASFVCQFPDPPR